LSLKTLRILATFLKKTRGYSVLNVALFLNSSIIFYCSHIIEQSNVSQTVFFRNASFNWTTSRFSSSNFNTLHYSYSVLYNSTGENHIQDGGLK